MTQGVDWGAVAAAISGGVVGIAASTWQAHHSRRVGTNDRVRRLATDLATAAGMIVAWTDLLPRLDNSEEKATLDSRIQGGGRSRCTRPGWP